jgi:hypothetical protein
MSKVGIYIYIYVCVFKFYSQIRVLAIQMQKFLNSVQRVVGLLDIEKARDAFSRIPPALAATRFISWFL